MAEKIEYLDGLRGIAAFLVVVHHFIMAFYPKIDPIISDTPLSVFFNGNFMVCIFFVLSGYVLTYKFFKTKDREVIVSGAIRRYFRLFFPVAFIILVAFILMSLNLFYNPQVANVTGSSWGREYWTFNQDLPGMIGQAIWDTFFGKTTPDTSYDYVLWTMGIEFIGSLIAFSYVMLFGKSRNRWLFYLVAGAFFLNTYYLAFILGVLLADIYSRENPVLRVKNKTLLLALFIVSLTIGSYTGAPRFLGHSLFNIIWPYVDDPTAIYHIAGAFILLLVVLNSTWLKQLLSTKLTLALGKLSFSVYLVHPLVLGSVSSIVFLSLYPRTPYHVATMAAFTITVIGTMFSAYIVNKYVDEPGTRLSKRIYERFFTGEEKSVSWQAIKSYGMDITRKNIYLLILLEVILLLLIGTMVFVAKPNMEHDHVEQVKIAYYDSRNSTINAFANISSYEKCNVTSVGLYNNWVQGYKSRVLNYSVNYRAMEYYGNMYKPYANTSEVQSIESDIVYYGNFANETMDGLEAHTSAYDAWYWNNTPPGT